MFLFCVIESFLGVRDSDVIVFFSYTLASFVLQADMDNRRRKFTEYDTVAKEVPYKEPQRQVGILIILEEFADLLEIMCVCYRQKRPVDKQSFFFE
jgi:hypothetical protein